MPVSLDSQGYVGDLHSKNIPELREILERQESILKKEKFVKSLPDKGRKVREYAESLQTVIKQKEDFQNRTKALRETKLLNQHSTKKTTSKFKQERSNLSTKSNSEFAEPDTVSSLVFDGETSSANVERDAVHLGSSKVIGVLNSDISNDGGDLENCFEKLNVSNSDHAEGFDDVPHPYINNYEAVISRGEEQERNRRKPFKINRTLKVENVNELPEKFKPHKENESELTAHENKLIQHVSPLDDEDIFPKYKYDKTKKISISQSLWLQQKQKEKQERMKAEEAVESLSRRLDCVMNEYGSKEVDMRYREIIGTLDSDDELDPEYPEVD